MLSCKEITELVTDHLEGRMRFATWCRFQMHIGMCRHCRRYLRQMRATVKALGRVPNEPPPADVEQELLRRFDSWKK